MAARDLSRTLYSRFPVAQPNPAEALTNIYRTPELWQKIVFTFICLLVYRTGAHVTVPGVDVQAITDYFANQRGGNGLLGLYDLFVGKVLAVRPPEEEPAEPGEVADSPGSSYSSGRDAR